MNWKMFAPHCLNYCLKTVFAHEVAEYSVQVSMRKTFHVECYSKKLNSKCLAAESLNAAFVNALAGD